VRHIDLEGMQLRHDIGRTAVPAGRYPS